MSEKTWVCPFCNSVLPASVGQCHHKVEKPAPKPVVKPVEVVDAVDVVEPVEVEKPAPKKAKKKAARGK